MSNEVVASDISSEEVDKICKIESIKELQTRVAARILEEVDANLGSAVKHGLKFSSVYTNFAEMAFLMTEFHDDNPVTLETKDGTELTLPVSINHGARYKEIISGLREQIGGAELQNLILSEAEGTHLEQFAGEYAEQTAITDAAEKKAISEYKKAFKHWMALMSQHYETNYNLMVEGCDIDSELRVVGLWVLGPNKDIEEEFYINPQYVADEINKGVKTQANGAKKADIISEKIGSIKGVEIITQVAGSVQSSLDKIPSILSSSKNMVSNFKNIRAHLKPANKQKKIQAVEGDLDIKPEGVEEI